MCGGGGRVVGGRVVGGGGLGGRADRCSCVNQEASPLMLGAIPESGFKVIGNCLRV